MIRRALFGAALFASLSLAGCGQQQASDTTGPKPKELVFSILSAESQNSLEPLWTPMLKELSDQLGVKVKPYFASNYTALVEAMRFNQVQMGWFSAEPALEASRRANAEVVARAYLPGAEGLDSYTSVLIARKEANLTIDDVLKCGGKLNFGIGDAKSTSGTLAPKYYLFSPKGIEPTKCFKTVRSANHQTNALSVANGVADVATNNSVGMDFFADQQPDKAAKVTVIWRSPPLPESSIIVRKDLDPALREKVRQFFITYGTGADAVAEKQKAVLRGLKYAGFKPADNSYLDPIREMQAAEAVSEAKRSGDAKRIAAAQAEFDKVRAEAERRRAPGE
jgi:phosphonate transport system substrate-binding protein